MTGARFSRIVIIQSLRADESPTGRHLRDAIEPTAQALHHIPVEYIDAQTESDFWNALKRVLETTRHMTDIPILHFECHGTSDRAGLSLADRTTIPWSTLKTPLVALNQATGCNLFVTLACCHGAMLMESLDWQDRSPCWGLLGPSGEVSPLDLKSSYSTFFLELLGSSNAATAARSLIQSPERKARYFLLSAEEMFRAVLKMYRQTCSTDAQVNERTERFTKILERHGAPTAIVNRTRSEIVRAERNILEGIFNRFFFVDHFPDNKLRFSRAYGELASEGEL
jgi:hypothetical protein